MRSPILWLVLAFEGGLALAAVGVGWVVGVSPFRALRFDWQALGLGVAATAPPVAAMVWSANASWPPFDRLRTEVTAVLGALFVGSSLVDFAIVSALAAIGEEMLFRGVMQGGLEDLLGPGLAIGVTSAAFGLVHLITPTYAMLAALLGVYLGWLVWVADNLMVALVVHGLYDFVALVYLTRVHIRPSPPTGHRSPNGT